MTAARNTSAPVVIATIVATRSAVARSPSSTAKPIRRTAAVRAGTSSARRAATVTCV